MPLIEIFLCGRQNVDSGQFRYHGVLYRYRQRGETLWENK